MSQLLSTPVSRNENNASPGNAPAPLKKRAMAESPENAVYCAAIAVTTPAAAAAATTTPVAPSVALAMETPVAPPAVGLPEVGVLAVTTPLASPESEVVEAPAPAAEEESADARLARETQESEDLARMFMAEEAEASFALQYQMLQSASADMNDADLVAVQALLRADEEMQHAVRRQDNGDGEPPSGEEVDEEGNDEGDETADDGANYDELVALGRAIGDVKAERWAFRSARAVDHFTSSTIFSPSTNQMASLCRSLFFSFLTGPSA